MAESCSTHLNTPLGRIRLQAGASGLERLEFDGAEGVEDHPIPLLDEAKQQLRSYFSRSLHTFRLPLNAEGSHFQVIVWEELQKIPYGKTISYETLAKKLGDIKMTRAVAAAIARNPIPLVIPCHRVVGKNGSLTGYSGGLHRKKQLLELEGSLPQIYLF